MPNNIYKIIKVKSYKLTEESPAGGILEDENNVSSSVKDIFENGFYFSNDYDLTSWTQRTMKMDQRPNNQGKPLWM